MRKPGAPWWERVWDSPRSGWCWGSAGGSPLKTGFIGGSILLVAIGVVLLALLPKHANDIAG